MIADRPARLWRPMPVASTSATQLFAALFAAPPLAVTLGPSRAQPIGWRRLVGD